MQSLQSIIVANIFICGLTALASGAAIGSIDAAVQQIPNCRATLCPKFPYGCAKLIPAYPSLGKCCVTCADPNVVLSQATADVRASQQTELAIDCRFIQQLCIEPQCPNPIPANPTIGKCCPTCPASGLPLVCPLLPPGSNGICVNLCFGDDSCPVGQKCCSNGCGRVCKVGVPGKKAYPMAKSECPPGVPIVNCFVNPCRFAKCPNYPEAQCIADYCGGCNAKFYQQGNEVTNLC